MVAWRGTDHSSGNVFGKVSADAEDLEESYHEWLLLASARLRELQETGIDVRKVDVDVEGLAGVVQASRPACGCRGASGVRGREDKKALWAPFVITLMCLQLRSAKAKAQSPEGKQTAFFFASSAL